MKQKEKKSGWEQYQSMPEEGISGKGFMTEKKDLLKELPVRKIETEVTIPIILDENGLSGKTFTETRVEVKGLTKKDTDKSVVIEFSSIIALTVFLCFGGIILWKFTRRKPK